MQALQRTARESGIISRMQGAGTGWSELAVVEAKGPDAAAWLQSQTTNDVEALALGQGHLNARVSRTGHVIAIFSVHRVAAQTYWMVLPAESADTLLEDLDRFLFADDVVLSRLARGVDAMGTGPGLADFWSPLGDVEPFGVIAYQGGYLVRTAFSGDDGVLAIGSDAAQHVMNESARLGLTTVDEGGFAAAHDGLRQEAGLVRVATDIDKRRLLPETGLEQVTVSYTKGCYLGQEVIARVRTYGSVPSALRALVLDAADLESLPKTGDPVLSEDGTKLGVFATWHRSSMTNTPVLLAFLGRAHRTPGARHVVRIGGGFHEARVALLPLHAANDRAARVDQAYDAGVRAFAEGRVEDAISSLERALSLDPSHADSYEAIGVILARTERYHEAIDVFRRLEEVAPHEALVNTNLSIYYMKLGDKETAEAQAALAARKSMSASSGKSAAEVAEEADEARLADARRKSKMFRQVLDFDPEDPIALFGLGTALSVLGQWEEAVPVLEQASVADGKNAAVFLAWGKALERLGRAPEAVTVYRQGMEVASKRGDLMPLREMEARVLLLG